MKTKLSKENPEFHNRNQGFPKRNQTLPKGNKTFPKEKITHFGAPTGQAQIPMFSK